MRKIAKSGTRSVKRAQTGVSADKRDIMNREAYLNRIMSTSRPDTLSSGERKERADIILKKVKSAQESSKQRKGGKTTKAKVGAKTTKAKYGAAKKASKRSK